MPIKAININTYVSDIHKENTSRKHSAKQEKLERITRGALEKV